jgi:hypothetical protein
MFSISVSFLVIFIINLIPFRHASNSNNVSIVASCCTVYSKLAFVTIMSQCNFVHVLKFTFEKHSSLLIIQALHVLAQLAIRCIVVDRKLLL